MQIRLFVVVWLCAFSIPALAGDSQSAQLAAELAALREQVAQMRSMYESRIAALEERLAIAGQASKSVGDAAASAQTGSQPMHQEPVSAGAKSGTVSFNPEVSLILQGAYAHRKKVEDRHIGGFVGAAGHSPHNGGHGHDLDKRGFNLSHTELILAANIDPYWRGQATFALFDGEVEVEEAWFRTTALGYGTGIKAGRFLSGIGYLNEQHSHQWDFYEQPLAYRALFGDHNYSQDGVQLKWVAPIETFVELGAEIGRGNRFPASNNASGANSHALFAHVGDDIGVSSSWRAGLSWLRTQADGRESFFQPSGHGGAHGHYDDHGNFSGRSRVWIADFVYKWAPNGNPARRNFKFQAEYFRRTENGDMLADYEDHSHSSLWRTRQSGYYLASVYQFTPNWRAGLRYDRLSSGRQGFANDGIGIKNVNYRPNRVSAMVDYSWSEFSRLRLQWSRDRAMPEVTDNQMTLQYIMSLGSHGAHKF